MTSEMTSYTKIIHYVNRAPKIGIYEKIINVLINVPGVHETLIES